MAPGGLWLLGGARLLPLAGFLTIAPVLGFTVGFSWRGYLMAWLAIHLVVAAVIRPASDLDSEAPRIDSAVPGPKNTVDDDVASKPGWTLPGIGDIGSM